MITVVGSHDGRAVTRFVLEHGEDPAVGLAARGWPGSVVGVDGVLGDLTFRYAVQPAEPVDPPTSCTTGRVGRGQRAVCSSRTAW